MTQEIFKIHEHTPPHLFRSNAKYFITGATHRKLPYLRAAAAKEMVIHYMFKSFHHFAWRIEDWILLDNHYHIMADAPENALTLSSVINNFHKFSAIWIKKNVDMSHCGLNTDRLKDKKAKIWYNYRDTCITYENSYFARLTYIWFNAVKHGYVNEPSAWRFGSFYYRNQKSHLTTEIINKYPWDKVHMYDNV